MVNQSIAAHIRTIPGVPVCNERQTSDFKTVQVNGNRLTAYPTSTGVVFYDQSLEYVYTLPFPTSSGRNPKKAVPGGDQNPCCGLSTDQEGSILVWKDRDVYVFRASRSAGHLASSSRAGQRGDVQWKLHSEIKCQNDVCKAELVKGTILLYHDLPEPTLEVWKLNSRLDFAVWERKALVSLCDELATFSLSPCESYIAYGLRRQSSVFVQALLRDGSLPEKIQRLSHPGKDCVQDVSWRGRHGAEKVTNIDTTQPAIYTFDAHNVIRLFTPVMDAPTHFQLVFNYRLTALGLATGIASSGLQSRRNGDHKPYHISSSETSENIFWQDRWGNIRCIEVQSFEAKPPCVLQIASEKMWTMSSSSQKAVGAPISSCLVSLLEEESVLVAEFDSIGRVISLGQVGLKNATAKLVKRATLNNGRANQRLWQEDRYARLIGTDDHGECTLWRQDIQSGLQAVSRFTIGVHHDTVEALVLLGCDGPLVYLRGSNLCIVDIGTSETLWCRDLEQQLQGGKASGLRQLLSGQLMVTLEKGSFILISLDSLYSIQDIQTVAAHDILPQDTQHKPSPSERKDRVLSNIPLGLEPDEVGRRLLVTSEGRLFWLRKQDQQWVVTAKLRVGAEDLSRLTIAGECKAACISDKDLLIWDVEDALYSNAAEHVESLAAGSYKVSWSSSSRRNHLLLAIGSETNIRILSQGRFSADSLNTAWSTWFEFDVATLSPFAVSDFALLPGGYLVVAAGPQLVTIDMKRSISARAELGNSSLPDFHRFHLEQCIVWNRDQQIRATLANLQTAVKDGKSYNSISPEAYWQAVEDETSLSGRRLSEVNSASMVEKSSPRSDPDLHGLEGVGSYSVTEELAKLGWSRKEVRGIDRMSAVLDTLDREGARIDGFGKRYMSALYMRASGPSRSAVPFRYVVWAMHSRRQAELLRASTEYWEERRLNWTEAKRMGTPFWLSDIDALRGHAEQIARNEFLSSERDPIPCSLLYFALNKKATVYGLWRQAYGHKEQQAMLKFLSNDFDQERWKGAALKNAYALLSKQRYEYAAAFFMLAGQPKDAIRICLRQMDDLEMAIMLARISDYQASHPGSGERSILELDKLDSNRPVPVCGEMLKEIIETSILPEAHKSGDRWLTHWAHWNLGQRGPAIRYLTLPLEQIGLEPDDSGQKIRGVLSGSADWVALYYELRKRYFADAIKTPPVGQNATAGWLTRVEEWNMVKHRSRRLWAMGFWDLSLAIVRDWGFIDHTYQSVPEETSKAMKDKRDGTDRSQEIPQEDGHDDLGDNDTLSSEMTEPAAPLQEEPPPKTKLSLFKENAVVVDSKQSQGALDFDMSSFF